MFGGIVGMMVLNANLGQELIVQILPPDAVCKLFFIYSATYALTPDSLI